MSEISFGNPCYPAIVMSHPSIREDENRKGRYILTLYMRRPSCGSKLWEVERKSDQSWFDELSNLRPYDEVWIDQTHEDITTVIYHPWWRRVIRCLIWYKKLPPT